MGLANFRVGQRIRLDGTCFELAGRLPSGNWQLVDIDTGLRDEQPEDALWVAYLLNKLRFIQDSSGETSAQKRLLSRLSEAAETTSYAGDEAAIKKAADHYAFVQKFNSLRGILPLKEAIHETWKQLSWPDTDEPSIRTVQYWRAKIAACSDPIAALRDKNERKGNRTERYPAGVIEIADRVVAQKYLRRTPLLSIAAATKVLARDVRKENRCRPSSERLPVPGRRLMESRIALVPEREQIAKRFGSDAALARMRTSLGGVKTTRALERGEIDHTLLAIVLLDDDFMPWGRASSSLCLDAHTEAPTGFYNGAEIPSTVSLSHCMECSVLPKTELLKQYPEVKGRWDCYGVHETYVMDNGMEEHATTFRHAASELGGSIIEYCARKAPWYKPHVERHFRAQDLDLLQTLPGCTGENIAARPAFDPKKDLLIRRTTFSKVYMKWLVDIYMPSPKASLGDISPAEAWKRSITLEDQLVPTRRILLQRLFLKKVKSRSLDHEGIQFDCLIYNSLDMGALRAQLGARLTVDIWVSDEDLGYIYVEVPGQDIAIKVPCLDQRYASGLTRWQHEKCKAMRRVRMDEGLQLSLDEARDEITKLIEDDLSELLHARRKKRTRFAGDSDPRCSDAAKKQGKKPETGGALVSAADQALMRSDDQEPLELPHASLPRGSSDDCE